MRPGRWVGAVIPFQASILVALFCFAQSEHSGYGLNHSQCIVRICSAFVFRSIAWSFHYDDFGVMDESIGDSGGDGGVVEDITPLCEDQIAGDDG